MCTSNWKLVNRFEIRLALRRHCCRALCQISQRSLQYDIHSCCIIVIGNLIEHWNKYGTPMSETPLTKSFWSHNRTFAKFRVVLMWQIIFRSGYNFAHDATAELSRHVQNCGMIWVLLFKLKQEIFLRDLDYELIIALWNGYRPSIVLGILAPPWPRHNIRTPQVDRHACASLMPVAHHWSARCWTHGHCDAGNSGNWLVFFGTDFEKTSSMVTLGFTQISYISWKDFF